MVSARWVWISAGGALVSIIWTGFAVMSFRSSFGVLKACSSGRLVDPCIGLLGTPDESYVTASGGRHVKIWKSSSKLDHSADIAIVANDGIIVELLDLDQPSGRQRLSDRYPRSDGH